MLLAEVGAAADHIKKLLDPEAHIVWGSAIDPGMAPGQIRVSIVATGLSAPAAAPLAGESPQPARAADHGREMPAPVAPVVIAAPVASSEPILCAAGMGRGSESMDTLEGTLGDLSRGALLFQRMTTVATASARGGPPAANTVFSKLRDDHDVYIRRSGLEA
jgi:hypothetical protein